MITSTSNALAIGYAIAKAHIEIIAETDDYGNDIFTAIAQCDYYTEQYMACTVKLVFDIDDSEDNFLLDHAEVGDWDSRFDRSFNTYDADEITDAFHQRLSEEWQEYKKYILTAA